MSTRIRKGPVLERSLRHGGIVPIERRGNVDDEVWDLDVIDIGPIHVTEVKDEHSEGGGGVKPIRAFLPSSSFNKEDIGARVFCQAVC